MNRPVSAHAVALPWRLGVCSWSLHPDSPQQLIDRVKACELSRLQLNLMPLYSQAQVWGDTGRMLADAGITIVSGMFGSIGENYATLQTIRHTGGFVLDDHWPDNQRNIERALDLGVRLGLNKISTHAGFIPSDHADPVFRKVMERLRWIADRFAERHLLLLLETGQETAASLWAFLDALERDNVRINFDPANMILYAMGDPVTALQRLLPRVAQVHIKDALPTTTPGSWGREVAVGDGTVDFPALLAVLQQGGYTGDLVIEREAGDRRVQEVCLARQRVSAWMQALKA
jgi:sugar phosphate isomerase/epimerase